MRPRGSHVLGEMRSPCGRWEFCSDGAVAPPSPGRGRVTTPTAQHPAWAQLLPTFLMPSEGLDTQLSAPPFLLMVRQSSANVLSCSRGLVPLARKYSYTAEPRTVPYGSSTCLDRSWNVLKGKQAVSHGPGCPRKGRTWAARPPEVRAQEWPLTPLLTPTPAAQTPQPRARLAKAAIYQSCVSSVKINSVKC